jgi:hypothetical protein
MRADTVQVDQDKVFAEIRSSATLSREAIEHANVLGCLRRSDGGNSQLREAFISDEPKTYTTTPLKTVTSALTGISLPFSSFAFVTLNADRTEEATMKSVASTM